MCFKSQVFLALATEFLKITCVSGLSRKGKRWWVTYGGRNGAKEKSRSALPSRQTDLPNNPRAPMDPRSAAAAFSPAFASSLTQSVDGRGKKEMSLEVCPPAGGYQ